MRYLILFPSHMPLKLLMKFKNDNNIENAGNLCGDYVVLMMNGY